MKQGQLWFLPILMQITLINYPLLAWSRRRAEKTPIGRQDFLIIVGQLITIFFFIMLCFKSLKNKQDFWNYMLPASFVLLLGLYAYMAFQVYLQRLKDDEYGYSIFLMIIGPIISVFFNFFRYGSDEKTFYGIGMMMCYHSIFYAQGIVN